MKDDNLPYHSLQGNSRLSTNSLNETHENLCKTYIESEDRLMPVTYSSYTFEKRYLFFFYLITRFVSVSLSVGLSV